MRRALTVFLLLILPLQLSWAVAAGYCQHEKATNVAGHMGHHEHQHSPGSEKAVGELAKTSAAEKQDTDEKPQCVDDDCAYCHLASLKAVGAPSIALEVGAESILTPQMLPAIESPMSARIDRPNWRAD
ncbi:cation efflux protein, CzcI family [Rhizobacter sp. LjRoot28]|uniref:cation efflux protein, CzcI family n=1 Tax=Rhizobacter sp. LjRoot28 TaxID=3342309 RepID=UPI003ED0752B